MQFYRWVKSGCAIVDDNSFRGVKSGCAVVEEEKEEKEEKKEKLV